MPDARPNRLLSDTGPTQPDAPRRAALSAWKEGEAAAAAGDGTSARRWFDRAHRLAPQQDHITLSLAMALLSEGDPQAITLLETVAARHDLRPVWLALAAAHRRAGDAAAAASALGRALSGHAWTRAEAKDAEILERIAAEAGRPGWCALAGDGTLLFGNLGRRDLALVLDGRPLAFRPSRQRSRLGLPAGWERAGKIEVTAAGEAVVGSPIRIAAIRRTEGFAECRDCGLAGWAWHPGEPDAVPVLHIGPKGKREPAFTIRASKEAVRLVEAAPLERPRRFTVPTARLLGIKGPISVRDRDGRELAGSPLDPRLEAAGAAGLARALAALLPAPGRRGRRGALGIAATRVAAAAAESTPLRPRPAGPPTDRRALPAVDVVVPVHGEMDVTLACLASVQRHLPPRARIVVVDDASPDPELARALAAMAAERKIDLVRHVWGRGFPAACNTGIRAARPDADIVLLNSDTRVAAGWISGLQAAALSTRDIGTATPFSNDATILSYPDPEARNPAPDAATTDRLARLAARLFNGRAVEIPTGVGFCLYLRRGCLAEVGLFREDLFAQGYGEENDFCIRARHLGWRHVAAPGVFMAHLGGQSFGAVGPALMRRNLELLNRLHPGYDDLIAAHREADPLFAFRRRLDAARFAATRRAAGAVLLVTHARGGGVERLVRARATALRSEGLRPLLLYPAERGGACRDVLVREAGGEVLPNLRYAVPRELGALARLLRAERPVHCEVHHLVGHDHAILDLCSRLDVPYDVYLHDYAALCGRIALVGREERYCGEPGPEVCAACIADAGSEIEEEIAPTTLVRRSAAELGAARRIIAPSADTAERIRRHFSGLTVTVEPWEEDSSLVPAEQRRFGFPRCIAVIGAIGTAKGYEVVLACARDAARRDLPLHFVLIGYSRDDQRLLDTGRVFVTGAYAEEELPRLIARERADFAFLPSVWPETWCFTLSEAWQAGLDVAAFDFGAPAARIRATGRGWLLPLGLSSAAINNALLSLNPLARG
ncbi:MAG: glycosyltransferase [Rhodospirillales bacterium]|nr:glycosyltransferase [Rhodospirillales bacterium]